jgi:hypothetical protein
MLLFAGKGWLLWLPALLIIASCQKERSCESCKDANTSGVNRPPIANAGTDQTIMLPSTEFILDGSKSTDPNNNITSYTWINISGPSTVNIANANIVKTVVAGFVRGTYLFELKVTDAYGLFSRDTVEIMVSDPNDPTGNWTKLPSLPEQQFFYGSNHINFLLGIGDKVFGISKNGDFLYYNPQTNEWVHKGNIPSSNASANFSVVFSIGNIGYIVGNGTSRQYNVLTNQWITKNNAPVGANHVDYSVPLVINNKAYLVGSTNNVVTLYDPASDTYTLQNRFPDVDAITGFVINNEAYCIQKEGRCWKYNASTDSWQQKASLPPSIYNMTGFSLNGFGYIIGDLNRAAFNQNGRLKMWRYNPSSDKWKQTEEDYPGQGAYEIRTVSLKGILYAGLGYLSSGADAIDFFSFK